MNVITAGSALLLSLPPKPHLWFVLTEPHGGTAIVVAVMVQTKKRHTDDTVVLVPGDHPFIRHETAVQYSTAQKFAVPALVKDMGVGRCHLRQSVSSELLARLQQGLLDSPFTVNAIRDYCAPLFGK